VTRAARARSAAEPRRRAHPRRPVRRDHVRGPMDWRSDEVGLSISGWGADLPREAGSKHEGLELQRAV